MKKIALPLLVFILSLFVINESYAQTWKWAVGSNCPKGAIESWPIAVDRSGNVYEVVVAANRIPFASVASTDTMKSYFGNDSVTGGGTMLVSTDSNGNYRWELHALRGRLRNVVTGPGNNVYIFGDYRSVLVFGTDTLAGSNSMGGSFCGKVNSSGHILWLKKIADSSICIGSVDDSGNIYVSGTFYGSKLIAGSTILTNPDPGAHGDAYLAKLDSMGNPLWARSFGGDSNEVATLIATNPSGETYISGLYYSPQITIDGVTLTNHLHLISKPYFFLMKFNNTGNLLWADSIATNDMDYLHDMKIDPWGNAYLVGLYKGDISFGSVSLPSTTTYKTYFTKYNKAGGPIWSETSSFAVKYNVTPDICGNVWVSGGAGGDNSFIAQYDSSGTLIRNMPLTFGGDDDNTLAVDNLGNLYFGGDYSVTAVVGSDTLKLRDSTLETLFIAKYSYPLCPEALSVEALPLTSKITASLFPNPATGECTVTTTSTSLILSKLQIFDITGRQLDEFLINGKEYTFNTGRLKPGIYACRITFSDQTTIIEKLVVSQ